MSAIAASSLDALFQAAVAQLQAVDDQWPALSHLASLPCGARTSPAEPDSVQAALSSLARVGGAVEQAALISSNDSLEEIATRSLKFMLVPLLHARAHAQVQGEPHERHAALQEARHLLSRFFRRADALRLLSDRERDLVLDDTPEPIRSAAQRRDEKIASFKAEKAAEKKLLALRERDGRDGDDDGEEAEREATLIVLQSGVRRGIGMLAELQQEMEILRFAVRQLERGVDPREKAQRHRPNGPPPGMGGLPATFRIVSDRQKAKEEVFRPSHSLPTYTVEEWGEIELARAVKAEKEKHEKDIVEARRKEEEDSDGDEAVERERGEKSRWDDWADEHNKGSGNTIR